jgi:hypothetical protein
LLQRRYTGALDERAQQYIGFERRSGVPTIDRESDSPAFQVSADQTRVSAVHRGRLTPSEPPRHD